MKLAALVGRQQFQLMDRDRRRVENRDVLIEVKTCGICTGELEVWARGDAGSEPFIWVTKWLAKSFRWALTLPRSNQETSSRAQVAQYIMDSFWTVPLYYTYNIYLAKPWLTNLVPNTFSWEQFFQLQYMKVLPH